MPRNLRNPDPCSVTLAAPFAGLVYGFGSRLAVAERGNFGQTLLDLTTLTAAQAETFIVGCEYPKPPRATLKSSTEYESSFCSDTAAIINALIARGATFERVKPKVPRLAGLAVTRYVQNVNTGVNYAYNTNAPAALVTAAGLQTPTAAQVDLVYGASYPVPARICSTPAQNDNVSGVESTFASNAAFGTPATGFAQKSGAKNTLPDLIKALR